MDKVLAHRRLGTGGHSIDFLYDAAYSISVMYKEANKFHFLHRQFQEYLAAEHLKNNIAGRYDSLVSYFEQQKHGWAGDSTFEMLYDMKTADIDIYLYTNYLREKVTGKEPGDRAYWDFLFRMYPRIQISQMPALEDFDEEDELEVYEKWLDRNSMDRCANRTKYFLYNCFVKRKGFSFLDELQEMDWPRDVTAYCGGTFLIRDGVRDNWGVLQSEKRLTIYDTSGKHYPLPYDLSDRNWLGCFFTIDPRHVYGDQEDEAEELYEIMNSPDFPLRKEYDAICRWLNEMSSYLRRKRESDDTVEAFCD